MYYENVKQWRENNREKYNANARKYRSWLKIKKEFLGGFSSDCFD